MERRRLQYMRNLLSRRPIFVFVDVSNGNRRIGEVVEINNLTTWVKIMIGAKTSIVIKRHNVKHHLEHYKMGEYYEAIHTEAGD
jgi:ribosomal protein S1